MSFSFAPAPCPGVQRGRYIPLQLLLFLSRLPAKHRCQVAQLLFRFVGKEVGYLFHWDFGACSFGWWDGSKCLSPRGGLYEKGVANEDFFVPIHRSCLVHSTGTSQRNKRSSLAA